MTSESAPASPDLSVPLRAAQIRAQLDEYMVGQIEAKERLSLLLSIHQHWDPLVSPLHPPPNGVIIGPTGSGKTFSIKLASEHLGVPFLILDTTSIVPHGARNGITVEAIYSRITEAHEQFVRKRRRAKTSTQPSDLADSESADSAAKRLLQRMSAGTREIQKTIVFLDEFDKIALRENDPNREWKADVQRALLKFVEGQGQDEDSRGSILVLASGAFVGIDGPEVTRKRRTEVSQLLRGAPKKTVVSDDIVNFGFMPELVARLPAVIQYEALSEEALLGILKHPLTSPLLVWQKHFAAIGKELRFEEKFLQSVARRASKIEMGARGLQQIVFPALARRAYAYEDSPEHSITVGETVLDFKEQE